ncbi:MAG: endonuclease III [Candidatus Aminicenantes bacterium]|nr:endonuclease III [Candidatus Aminicenantes bacterium]
MKKPAKAKVNKILRVLENAYPRSRTSLKYENPLQILIATILSAQCTDTKVNEITPSLFKKYPTVKDFAEADREELEHEIHSTGFYRNKTKSILGAANKIVKDFNGYVPDSMKDLLTLPGVARKTANIVLSSGYGKSEGIAVDTHVKRISGRLGFSSEKDPDKIEQDLLAIIPKKDWLDFNYILVNHGRMICQARKPRCAECPVRLLCPSSNPLHQLLDAI